ncbi:hypothetical protein G6F22_017443 [Rhizopus arrhizus]|nr:hypothetical protein G6F22_017443 [Rhizopus arrhizus]
MSSTTTFSRQRHDGVDQALGPFLVVLAGLDRHEDRQVQAQGAGVQQDGVAGDNAVILQLLDTAPARRDRQVHLLGDFGDRTGGVLLQQRQYLDVGLVHGFLSAVGANLACYGCPRPATRSTLPPTRLVGARVAAAVDQDALRRHIAGMRGTQIGAQRPDLFRLPVTAGRIRPPALFPELVERLAGLLQHALDMPDLRVGGEGARQQPLRPARAPLD